MKRLTYITLILLVILIIILSRLPDKTDWSETYSADGSNPLDLKVLAKYLPRLLPDTEFFYLDQSLSSVDSILDSVETFFHISGRSQLSVLDASNLVDFAARGGRVFISSNDIQWRLLDTLSIDLVYAGTFETRFDQVDPEHVCGDLLIGPEERLDYCLPSDLVYMALQGLDTTHIDTLGFMNGKPNLLRVPFGAGVFYLHSQPAVFSNYALLYEGTSTYVAEVLGVLSAERMAVMWRTSAADKRANRTMLYVLSQHRALRWAWNILYLVGLLFLFFGAKRRVKAVPIIKPYENATAMRVRQLATHLRRQDKGLRQLARLRMDQVDAHRLQVRWNDTDSELYASLRQEIEGGRPLTSKTLQALDRLCKRAFHAVGEEQDDQEIIS